jgi:predicted transcriptional regulator
MVQPRGRRSSLEIIADILRLLRLGSTGKTEIMYVSKISRDQATRYLQRLTAAGVVEAAGVEMGLPAYRVTPKGLALLSQIENLREKLPPDENINVLHYSRIEGINVGNILVTGGIARLSRERPEFAAYVQKSLQRYRKGDWGEMSDQDKLLNEQSLERNMRLFASYESGGFPEIWVITEPDRSYTTIMLPDEYASTAPLERYEPDVARTPETGKQG